MRARPLFFFLVLVLFFTWSNVSSQDKRIDSLTQLVKTAPNDSMRVVQQLKLVFAYSSVNTAKALEMARQTLKMAKLTHSTYLTGRSYNVMGICMSMMGQYDSAIAVFQQAIPLLKDPAWLSNVYVNIGISYDFEYRFDKSLEAYLKALEILGKDGKEKYYIMGSIANTYRNLKNFRMAEHYDTIAIGQAKREHGSEDIISLLEGNYAITLNVLNRLSESRKLLRKSIAYSKKTGQKYYLANHYKELADVETKEHNYTAAYNYHTEALKLHEEGGNRADMAYSYTKLCELDLLRNDVVKAEEMARKALPIADSLNRPETLRNVYEELSKIALIKHNLKDYVYYDSINKVLSDTINLQGQAKAVNELKTRYETEKKENENVLLRQKQLAQELSLKNQRYTIVLVTGSLLAVVVFLIFVYRNNKRARRTNLELTLKNQAILNQQTQILQQNNEIENKNQELRLRIEEIQRIQDQLIQSEKMASLGQMTAGIAHEINNPLNFISGGVQGLSYTYKEILEMLQKPQSITPDKLQEVDTDANALFNALKNGVDRMSKIINSLRSFSSPQKTEHVDTRMEDVMEMALTLLTPKIKEFNVQVERHYAEESCLASINSIQISQVFVNIVDNAIQAMENIKTPRILKIQIARVQERVAIKITDTGMGIAPSDQRHIMEPFFTTKPVGKGTGLGLSISYSIIESHQGKIRFESEVGKGTTFIIELPCNSTQTV
jgi:two-component system NtrC family sensor kinase